MYTSAEFATLPGAGLWAIMSHSTHSTCNQKPVESDQTLSFAIVQ